MGKSSVREDIDRSIEDQVDSRDIFEKALDAGKWGLALGGTTALAGLVGGKGAKNLARVVARPRLTKAELAETDQYINKFSRRAGYVGSAMGAGIGGSHVGAQKPRKMKK